MWVTTKLSIQLTIHESQSTRLSIYNRIISWLNPQLWKLDLQIPRLASPLSLESRPPWPQSIPCWSAAQRAAEAEDHRVWCQRPVPQAAARADSNSRSHPSHSAWLRSADLAAVHLTQHLPEAAVPATCSLNGSKCMKSQKSALAAFSNDSAILAATVQSGKLLGQAKKSMPCYASAQRWIYSYVVFAQLVPIKTIPVICWMASWTLPGWSAGSVTGCPLPSVNLWIIDFVIPHCCNLTWMMRFVASNAMLSF